MNALAEKVFNLVLNKKPDEAIRFIKTCSDKEKEEILLDSKNIWYLARAGKARALIEIIGKLKLPVQEKILCGGFIGQDLVNAGEGRAFLDLVYKQPVSARQNILDSQRTRNALRDAGFEEEVDRMIKNEDAFIKAPCPDRPSSKVRGQGPACGD